jgi:hypothetical protein
VLLGGGASHQLLHLSSAQRGTALDFEASSKLVRSRHVGCDGCRLSVLPPAPPVGFVCRNVVPRGACPATLKLGLRLRGQGLHHVLHLTPHTGPRGKWRCRNGTAYKGGTNGTLMPGHSALRLWPYYIYMVTLTDLVRTCGSIALLAKIARSVKQDKETHSPQ